MDENADGGVVTAVATENASEVTVDNEHFEVADGNLKLKAGNMLDFEADESPIEVTITATSEGGDATATVSVSINDVNESPTIDVRDGEEVPMHPGVISNLTIPENAMRGDIPPLALIEVMDPDAADADMLTGDAGVAATSVSDDRFAVILDPVDGLWLHLAEGASLDYEEASEVEVTVTFTDSAGNTAEQTVTVTVTDVNEGPNAPTVVNADELSVDENDPGASVSSVEATTDPEGDTDITYHVDDDRFEIDDGRVLKLKDGMYLNHESESYVMVTVSAMDSDGNEGAGTTVTVHVNDVNEGPEATGSVANVTADAGKSINVAINLSSLFADPDEGDAPVRWELSGNPSWLGLEVEFATDDDGREIVIGHLRGVPPTTGEESAAANRVTLTAKDGDGAAGELTFHVIVDDGNDDVTGINLLDHDGNEVSEAEVDENDASGVVLGRITVDDADHPLHPNGMHLVTVDDPRFEITEDDEGGMLLALKEGVSLNHEDRREGGVIEVEITAVDMNGEQNSTLDRAFGAPKYKGSSDTATFTILVNDLNDAPRAGTIGNWWVTVDDDLEAENVDAGDLLSVFLETQGTTDDDFPAFRDDDLTAGDSLTYSISGASWVQINERSGKITNVEDVIPSRGVHRVTVTATDEDGESASASFNVNVAHSDEESSTDARLIGENNDPRADNASGNYNEGSGEQRVATFRVSDRDQDIPDHLFAIRTVQIVSVENARDTADDLNAATFTDHDSDPETPDILTTTITTDDGGETGYAAAFRLSDPIKSGNTWTYHVYVRDTNLRPGAANDTTRRLDHEDVEEIDITVRVTDGTGATDDAEIRVDINNVNEKPLVVGGNPGNPTGTLLSAENRTVNQSEANKIVLFIKLEEFWSDPDEDDDSDDLIFGASTSASWIDIKHGPAEWGDIQDNLETGQSWGDFGTDVTERVAGSAGAPADGDMVVIVEIDRTDNGSQAQGERGSFTLTARDDGGATGSVTAVVSVTDQNLDIVSTTDNPAVTISGSAREGSTLRARFNENNDPDLTGAESAVLVLYTWYSIDDADATPTDGDIVQRGTSSTLSLTQSRVGGYIQVQVTYYEVVGQGAGPAFPSQFITTADTDGQLAAANQVTIQATTERAVSNSPDDGVGHFTITVGSDLLTASAVVRDEDYGLGGRGPAAAAITYSWQVSSNGVGGWRDAPDDGDSDTNSATYSLDDGEGRYYRAVATYDADGASAGTETESVYSDPIQIANVANAANTDVTPNTPDRTPDALSPTGSPNPGGTLSVSGRGVSSVQWQVDSPALGEAWTNIPGATGDLSVTAALAGSTVRALVTYETVVPGESGVTAVVLAVDGKDLDADANTTENGILIGGSSTTARPTPVDDHTVTGSVMGTGHAARGPNGPITGVGTASGHTVSVTETVPLASLFQDPDSSRLSFTAAGDAASDNTGADLTSGATSGGSYLFQGETGVLVLNVRSGELTYVSDQLRGHDGAQADGMGNRLTLNITANDSPIGADSGNSGGTADVNLRINVAPTGIDLTAGTGADDLSDHPILSAYVDATGTAVTDTTTAIAGITVNELVEATGREVLATINVQDENWSGTSTIPGHPFGVHEVTVTGDDRFVITKTNGSSPLTRDDGDGSTWELRLKRGATFDHETDDTDPLTDGTQIKLTFMATDGGGLSTPVATGPTTIGGNGYIPITLIITVEDNPADSPAPPGPTETPGLRDNETSDDDTTDDGTDDETDGGAPPPPPGMSLGGIIEDFVDNMDTFEQDLLEDFLLVIDDIDVA